MYETDERETVLGPEYDPLQPADFADTGCFAVCSAGVPGARAVAVDHDPYDELAAGALLCDSGCDPCR